MFQFWMTLKAKDLWNFRTMQCCGHFDSFFPSLASILTKQHSIRSGKYLLKTPGNGISETLNIKLSLDASALKNLCLWCEFESHLLFIISPLLKKLFDSPLLGSSLHLLGGFWNLPGSRNFTVFLLRSVHFAHVAFACGSLSCFCCKPSLPVGCLM